MKTTPSHIHTSSSTITAQQWEDLLEADTANFFQTPATIDFFKTTGLETFSIGIEVENRITAFVTGIIQKENGIKASFTSRAIIFGGPIITEKATEEDIVALLETLKDRLKNKVIYIEFRNLKEYHSYTSIFEKTGFSYQPHVNFHLDCTDSAAIKKRMSSSKLRQIKKSIKSGATIIEAETITQIQDWYAILDHLYTTKIKTPVPDINFFTTLWKHKIATFLLIQYQDEIIGGIVCPIFKKETIYEWFVCGKDGVFKNVYPSILATWGAMEYANTNGITYFDFMGAGKPDEDYGVREFKSKFGGALVEHGRYLHVTKPLRYGMGKMAVKILKR